MFLLYYGKILKCNNIDTTVKLFWIILLFQLFLFYVYFRKYTKKIYSIYDYLVVTELPHMTSLRRASYEGRGTRQQQQHMR